MKENSKPLFKYHYNNFDDGNEIDDFFNLYENKELNEKGQYFLDIVAIYFRLEIFLDIDKNNNLTFHNIYFRSAWDEEYKRIPYTEQEIGSKILELINDFISRFLKKEFEEPVPTEADFLNEFLSFCNVPSVFEIDANSLDSKISDFLVSLTVEKNLINEEVIHKFKEIFLN